jgi:glycosyltransferase involved in cell wall biosynthesis
MEQELKKNINVTVATSLHGCGGIATVLTGYQQSGLLKSLNSNLIVSHKKGKFGKLSLMLTFLIGIVRFFLMFFIYKVNIVHVHMSDRASYTRKSIFVRLAKFLDAKVIIHLHSSEFQRFYSVESSLKKQSHIRSTFNMADKVIVLSTQWKEWVNTIVRDSEKVCIIYNTVPRIQLPKKTDSKDIILFLGRVGKRKGTADLINAFSLISNIHPNAVLHLGGDGDLEECQKLIDELNLSQKVKLLGWVSGKEKEQCLSNATVYCLPSYNEGFPMGILEAMSNKIAIVSSKAGGIPDAIADQKEGLLIDAGDIKGLAKALAELLSCTELRESYADCAFVKYIENFSPEVINLKVTSVYNELEDI